MYLEINLLSTKRDNKKVNKSNRQKDLCHCCDTNLKVDIYTLEFDSIY